MLRRLLLILSFLKLEETKPYIIYSKFGQLGQLIINFTSIECKNIDVSTFFSVTIDLIILILASNKNMHTILDDF